MLDVSKLSPAELATLRKAIREGEKAGIIEKAKRPEAWPTEDGNGNKRGEFVALEWDGERGEYLLAIKPGNMVAKDGRRYGFAFPHYAMQSITDPRTGRKVKLSGLYMLEDEPETPATAKPATTGEKRRRPAK